MSRSFVNRSAEARETESKNALYIASVVICIAQGVDISTPNRDAIIVNEYNTHQNAIGYMSRGIRFVCSQAKQEGTRLSRRKCRYFAMTVSNSNIWCHPSIIDFAETMVRIIFNDHDLSKAYIRILSENCYHYAVVRECPTERDCVEHIFGFQYRSLSNLYRTRRESEQQRGKEESKKTYTILLCKESMDAIVKKMEFPNKCKSQGVEA